MKSTAKTPRARRSVLRHFEHKTAQAERTRARRSKLHGHRTPDRDPSLFHFEAMEPRVLLSADVFGGALDSTQVADYVGDPDTDLGDGLLDNFAAGFDLVEGLVEQFEGSTEFQGELDIDLPGLLDRSDADPANYEAPSLDEALDVDTVLSDAGFNLEASAGDVDQPEDIFDANGSGTFDFADLLHAAVTETFSGLADVPGASLDASTVVSALEGISQTYGDFVLTVDGVTFDLTHVSGDDYEFTFDLDVDLARTDTFSLDLGRTADSVGLDYGADDAGSALPEVDVETSVSIETTVGLAATITDFEYDPDLDPDTDNSYWFTVVNGDGGFFLRDTTFSMGAEVDAQPLDPFELQFGFLEIETTGGTFDLTAAVQASLTDPDASGEITAAELEDALGLTGGPLELSDLAVGTPGGSLDVALPIEVSSIPGYSAFSDAINALFTGTPEIQLGGSPFTSLAGVLDGAADPRTAPTVNLDGFDPILAFRNVQNTGVVGLLEDFRSFVEQFEALSGFLDDGGDYHGLFGFDLPFAEATSVLDNLAFGETLEGFIDDIAGEVGGVVVPDFHSAQSLASELEYVLGTGLGAILPTFDDATNSLSFTVALSESFFPGSVDPDFSLDLAPLADLDISGSISFSNEMELLFTFGIDMAEVVEVTVQSGYAAFGIISQYTGAGTQTNPIPSNGQLSANAKLRLNFGGFDSIEVDVLADDTNGNNGAANASVADLADDLQSAIDAALSDAGVDRQVVVDTVGERLHIKSFDSAFMQIEVHEDDAGGFAELGFVDGQEAVSSPLPRNGVLSDDVSFSLTVNDDTRTVTVPAANTLDNDDGLTDINDVVGITRLLSDIQSAIDVAFNSVPGWVPGTIQVTLDGGNGTGDRFRILPAVPTDVDFLRIDDVSAVGVDELGLVDDTLISNLSVTGDRLLEIQPDDAGNALPADGVLGSDQSFTIEVTASGVTTPFVITVAASATADNTSAEDLVDDVNQALAEHILGDRTLNEVVVANLDEIGATGDYGIRFSIPFAVYDGLALSGITGDAFGLTDQSAAVVGPPADGQPGTDVVFTVELVDGAGNVTSAELTIPETGGTGATDDNTSLAELIDDINDVIDAGSLAGQVVAGLSNGRIVLAATPAAGAEVIRITTPAGVDPAQTQFGFEDNMTGRVFADTEGWVLDASLDASLGLSATASGSGRFGFVEVGIGDIGGSIDGSVHVDLGAGGTRFQVSDLIEGLSDLTDLDDLLNLQANVGVSGSVALTMADFSISGTGDGGIIDDLQGILTGALGDGLVPEIDITMSDLTDLASLAVTPNVDFQDIPSLFDWEAFGLDDVLALLQDVVGVMEDLQSGLDFLSEPLPLIGLNLGEEFGFIGDLSSVVDDTVDALTQAAENPVTAVQDLYDWLANDLFPEGLDVDLGFIVNSPGVLNFELGFDEAISGFLPLDLDLQDLIDGTPFDGLLPEDLVNLSGQANLAADFGIAANLAFGIQPGNPLESFVKTGAPSAGGTGFEVTAFAEAENVNFTGAIGPLGVFVSDGAAVINSDGVLGNATPASFLVSLPDGSEAGRLGLDELPGALTDVISGDASLFDIDFGVGAVLPTFFPTASSFLGNIDFTANLDDPFDLGSLDYVLNSFPDFTEFDLSDLGLLDGISLFLEGVDFALGTLGDIVSGEIFGISDIGDLPLIGDALDDAGQFIEDVRNAVVPLLTNTIEDAPELVLGLVDDVWDGLQYALDDVLGFLNSPVDLLIDGVSVLDGPAIIDDLLTADEFYFDIDLGGQIDFEAPNIDFGLPALNLQIDEPLDVLLDFGLNIGFGVSMDQGFFLKFDPDGDDLNFDLRVSLPDTITGRLGFLQADLVNNNPDPFWDLLGFFQVDVEGTDGDGRLGFGDIGDLDFDVDFGARADLDFDLHLGVNDEIAGGIFPSLVTGLGVQWGFGDFTDYSLIPEFADQLAELGFDVNDPADQLAFFEQYPEIPLVTFDGLGLDLGSFLSDTIAPIVDQIQGILDPVEPLLSILVDPIPVISDLGPDVSLLDLAATFGLLDPGLIQALELIIDLAQDIGGLDFGAIEDGSLILNFIDAPFTFGGLGGLDLSDADASGALSDTSQAFTDVLGDLAAQFGIDDALAEISSAIGGFDLSSALGSVTGNTEADFANDFFSGSNAAAGGFSFPFLEDVSQVFGILFGRQMTLVTYDMPALTFGFEYDAFFPIWGPLGVNFGGGIEATLDFAFGYDTAGIQMFADNGFRNPLDLFQGFFIYDDTPQVPGVDVPEVTLHGEITAAAAINIVVAEVGVGGGVFADIYMDLNDPDGDFRVRIDEILGNLYNGFQELGPLGPICLFDTSGLIEAHMFAYVEALFGAWRKEWQFGPSVPLIEFDYSCPHPPVLATDLGDGTLRLNMGEFADDRLYHNTTDGDEDFTVVSVGDDIQVSAFGYTQTYSSDTGSFDTVLGRAGQGDDVIDASGLSGSIVADLRGGAGADTLTGGAGSDVILGDAGDDILSGNGGQDLLVGGTGNDRIRGGSDEDRLEGNKGDDTLVGGGAADVIVGGSGDDVLSGEGGADTALGGSGRDLISGGGGADVLQGEADDDRIFGDRELVFDADLNLQFTDNGGGAGFDIDVDAPDLTLAGTAGDDLISGGGGSDVIRGEGGDDRIWADSLFAVGADDTVADVNDPTLLLPGFGTFGHDTVSGGGGDDTIFGEKGNDVLRGDNVEDLTIDDDLLAGIAHGDGDTSNDDVIYAGRGADTVFGNEDDDELYGEGGNDYLLGNQGADTITGADGGDVIFGDDGAIVLYTLAETGVYTRNLKDLSTTNESNGGNDVIDGGLGDDFIFGGPGTAASPAIEDEIEGGAGDDLVFGDNGHVAFDFDSTLDWHFQVLAESTGLADGGDDDIRGSSGLDILLGGAGNDNVEGDVGDEPEEVDSRDYLMGDHAEIVSVINTTLRRSEVDTITSTETDVSHGGDDVLNGRQHADVLIGGPGSDQATGGGGDDVILGDRGFVDFDDADRSLVLEIATLDTAADTLTGVDTLSGGQDDDVVMGGGQGDTLYGDAEVNGTVLDPAVSGTDVIVGDNGQMLFVGGVRATITTTDGTNATGGDDTVEGNQSGDVILGGVGSDDLSSQDGDDIVVGDNGDVLYNLEGDGSNLGLDVIQTTDFSLGTGDEISGGAGRDILIGGSGADRMAGDDDLAGTPDAAPGDDILIGDQGEILYDSVERITDIATTDVIAGDGDADDLRGNEGSDILLGGVAGDRLRGNSGDDILLGDEGFLRFDVAPADGVANAGDEDPLTVDLIATRNTPVLGGADEIFGNGGRDVAFGGTAGDVILGDNDESTEGSGVYDAQPAAADSDILIGDQGEIAFFDTDSVGPTAYYQTNVTRIESTDEDEVADGGADLIEGNDGSDVLIGGVAGDRLLGESENPAYVTTAGDDVILGDEGVMRFDVGSGEGIDGAGDDDPATVDLIATKNDPVLGGDDAIFGYAGRDILLGGTGADTILGDNQETSVGSGVFTVTPEANGDASDADIAVGDQGEVTFSDSDSVGPTAYFNTNVTRVETTDTDEVLDGGADLIEGNDGSDFLLGGVAGDRLLGESEDPTTVTNAGDDAILGDEGVIRFDVTGADGIDNAGDGDPATIDWIATKNDPVLGGDDAIFGYAGSDILLGGTGADTILGDNQETAVGSGVFTVTPEAHGDASGDDIAIGDQGEVTFSDSDSVGPTAYFNTNVTRIETTDEDEVLDGGIDLIEGNDGSDFVLGGVAGDRLLGESEDLATVTTAGEDVIVGDEGIIRFDVTSGDGIDNAGDGDPATVDWIATKNDPVLGGDDAIFGYAGSDILLGGTGADTILGDNQETAVGSADFSVQPEDAGDASGRDIAIGDQGEITFADSDSAGRTAYFNTNVTRVESTDDDEVLDGGADRIEGNDLGDILIGGVASDRISGEAEHPDHVTVAGDDILIGDEGRVRFDVTSGEDLGSEGTGDGDPATLDLIETLRVDLGDADELFGNGASDTILGGTAGDTILGDLYDNDGGARVTDPTPGADTVLGDFGRLRYHSDLPIFITTTDPSQGGSDDVEGNEGADLLIGGIAGDEIYGESADLSLMNVDQAGDDIILGDNGQLSWVLEADDIDGRADVVAHEGGTTVSLDDDRLTLDRITTTDPTLGGQDRIEGNGASDLIFGGTDRDLVYGDTSDSGAGPDGADGQDLVFGDHGKIYPTLPLIDAFYLYNNFFSIDTAEADLGAGDILFGNGARDIAIGGQGDDILFGGTGEDDLIGGHNVSGGHDELDDMDAETILAILPTALADLDPTDLAEVNDIIDGDADDDAIAGDNAIIYRTVGDASPRFRSVGADGVLHHMITHSLEGLVLVDVGFEANVTAEHRPHQDVDIVRQITLLDHSEAIAEAGALNPTAPRPFGNDVIAGGGHDDEIFGQLGEDVIQGDGSIGLTEPAPATPLEAYDPAQDADPSWDVRDDALLTFDGRLRFDVFEAATDQDDYVEGGGGNDRIYGNLGQDDLIGGSSRLFGLDSEDGSDRPDGADLIYGGAGNPAVIARSAGLDGSGVDASLDTIVDAADRHGEDADTIMGDNADVFRIVELGEVDWQVATFLYDDAALDGYGDTRIVPRAVTPVDYGYDYEPAESGEVLTFHGIGAGDLIYGETGDDVIHGMTGDDVVFGNGGDDDLYGEAGRDILIGGLGQDGILGDDGLLLTSRNTEMANPNDDDLAEPLHGVAKLEEVNLEISTPGNIQRAIINLEGELKKAVDLLSFRTDDLDGQALALGQAFGSNDILFGGLGGDFLHAGDGDDAVSGAEALPLYYSAEGAGFDTVNTFLKTQQDAPTEADPTLAPDPFWYSFAPYNPGDILRFEGNGMPSEFALYDEYAPRRKVMLDLNGEAVATAAEAVYDFLLNFDETEGPDGYAWQGDDAVLPTDGDDVIFGDLGNDWIVGGTGRDHMYGGRGDDLLNMDDNHDSGPGGRIGPHDPPGDALDNTASDEFQAYADITYGGAGRDVMILNTGADRALDWVGEFNSFIVPFSPFGAFHISRSLQPHVPEFLQDLSASGGADQTLPDGQQYVTHKNLDVRTDDPDPARHYEPFGELGMVLQPDYDWQDQTGAPADPQPGNLQGPREIMRRELFTDPNAPKPFAAEAGTWDVQDGSLSTSPQLLGEESVSVYHLNETLPSYAEILVSVSSEKDKAGWNSNGYIIFDYWGPNDFKFAGVDQGLDKIRLGHRTADGWVTDAQLPAQLKPDTWYDLTLAMHGTVATIYVDGASPLSFDFGDPLNDGMLGLGTDNAITSFDDYQVQVLPPTVTFQMVEDFEDGVSLYTPRSGAWQTEDGRWVGDGTAETAVASLALDVIPASRLWLESAVQTDGLGGLVFDSYETESYKFAALDATTDQLVIGHVAGHGLVIDAATAFDVDPAASYHLEVSIIGSSVSVAIDGQDRLGHVFNSLLNDGEIGTLSEGGVTHFDDVTVSGDDPNYAEDGEGGEALQSFDDGGSLSVLDAATDDGTGDSQIDWGKSNNGRGPRAKAVASVPVFSFAPVRDDEQEEIAA